MEPRVNYGSTKRNRQARLYEELMGEEALRRQVRLPVSRRFVEPDECNCGWQGVRGRAYGDHHSDSCPRRHEPII